MSISSGAFAQLRNRCTSKFRWPSDGGYKIIRCDHAEGHSGLHESRADQVFVKWSDSQAFFLHEVQKEPREEVIGEVVGWRAWLTGTPYAGSGLCLMSLRGAIPWMGPRITVRPRADDREALREVHPSNNPMGGYDQNTKQYDHGIYSYKTPLLMLDHLSVKSNYTVGKIGNLGHVVEHELGYRAQIAVVRELWIPPVVLQMRRENKLELEKRYDCPVHKLNLSQTRAWAQYYSDPEEE